MKRPFSAIVLTISACWVFYNAVFSATILYFDALGYDSLGQMITQGKFIEHLSNGPTREPLYLFFVAMNIAVANFLNLPYLELILVTQGLLLLIAQLILDRIFIRIKLMDGIAALLLAYVVISPTLLRSSLIVYSEIITYPFILLACLTCVNVWQALSKEEAFVKIYKIQAVFLGACFLPLVFIKSIFEMIVPVCIIFIGMGLYVRFKSHTTVLSKIIVFLVFALGTFLLPVHAYKMFNKVLHGNYTFTDRGSWALYGTTARRVLPTSADENLAQKFYVLPDKSICEARVSKQACDHWFYTLSDKLGYEKYAELKKQGLSSQHIDNALMKASSELMIQHPFKMINGMFWEGAKLLFWEYPSWGMVVLPREIRAFYEQPLLGVIFLYGINAMSVLLFFVSLGYALLRMRHFVVGHDNALIFLMMTLVIIVTYIVLHSLFFLNERNALPIVPLFLVLYGSILQCLFGKKTA